MGHPRRANVEDVVVTLEVLVVEFCEGGPSIVVDVVHEARVGVEVAVVSWICRNEMLGDSEERKGTREEQRGCSPWRWKSEGEYGHSAGHFGSSRTFGIKLSLDANGFLNIKRGDVGATVKDRVAGAKRDAEGDKNPEAVPVSSKRKREERARDCIR